MVNARTRATQGTEDHRRKMPVLHGCAPHVVLAVPQEEKLQVDEMSGSGVFPEARHRWWSRGHPRWCCRRRRFGCCSPWTG